MKLKDTTISKMNEFGKAKKPFLFIIDFDEQHCFIEPLDQVDARILYNFNSCTNASQVQPDFIPSLQAYPLTFDAYQLQFNAVQKEIAAGNTYLINLTIETPITLNGSLNDVFHFAKAKYKLCIEDQFVCFSPETFVQIKNNRIYSFPMKGTIDASLPNAQDQILNDPKETAEHYTIVDLIRNDLNIVSKNVKVDQFRYLDKLKTSKGSIYQMSSQISGDLSNNWNESIGDLFQQLLPAGSITGSPKERTVQIINEVEPYKRHFYTGICGIYDGENLDSAVMIRFIEKNGVQFTYKSGGGITFSSEVEKEYNELIQKIYIPH